MEFYHFAYPENHFNNLKHTGIINSAQYKGTNGMYNEIIHGDPFKVETSHDTDASGVVESFHNNKNNKFQAVPGETSANSRKYDQERNKPVDKVLRRLAQNREAARKSRLKKKAYVQKLESSRIKLAQLEQELTLARQQRLYISGISAQSCVGVSVSANSGIAAFEMEYARWVDEQNKLTFELRDAIKEHVSDIELEILVERGMRHYDKLFDMKEIVSKCEVFYLMSGMWKTPAERLFLWIGGFQPSQLLKVLTPQLDSLTNEQLESIWSLQQSSQQVEDALSQGLNWLQQTLAETLTCASLDTNCAANYMEQMTNAMGKLDSLVCFVNQADLLRRQTLHQMQTILTIRQAARALLALGDHFHKLRTLSSLWARSREPPLTN